MRTPALYTTKIKRQEQSKGTVKKVLKLYLTGDYRQKEIGPIIGRSFERVRMIIHQELPPEQIRLIKQIVTCKKKVQKYQTKLYELSKAQRTLRT